MKMCSFCGVKQVVRKFCSKKCRVDSRKILRLEYLKANKEKVRIAQKAYVEKNKEKVLAYNKQWLEQNKEHCKKYGAAYAKQNVTKIRQYNKEYFNKYADEIKEKARLRRLAWTPEKIKTLRKQAREEYRTNPAERFRKFVSNSFRRIASNKPARTEHILGCSFLEAKQHIENLFQEGMTWENYGKWHIDHIKPIASIDPTDMEAIKQVNHISNLQPLWAKDNISKGAKYQGVDYRKSTP